MAILHRLLCLFLLVVSLSSQAVAQDTTFFFETPTAPLGRFSQEQFPITYDFRFLNEGATPMEVYKVEPDCACAIADFSKGKIANGDYGYITVSYSPYKAGPFEKTFKVYAKGAIPNSTVIKITGFIEPFDFEPNREFPHKNGEFQFKHRQVLLGSITNEAPIRKEVEFYNPNNFPISLDDSVKGPDFVEVIFDTAEMIPPNSVGKFLLFYHPELKNDYGVVLDSLTFYMKGMESEAFSLPVTANISQYFPPESKFDPKRPVLSIPTKTIHLGRTTLGDGKTVDFELKNEGENDLLIYKTLANYGGEVLGFPTTIPSGETVKLTVSILNINKRGKQDRSFIIYSNDPNDPIQKLSVTLDARD